MLSPQENEAVTHAGPGTLMGALFRRYWLPALLSWELEADSAPVRFKLLGESLLAFRDTKGRIGLMEELCPHRQASLALGRNEEEGLRCLYHGWKFDVRGQCVDMPNEPATSNFKNKVRVKSYLTREHAGVVWAYLGVPDRVPPFPIYKWTTVSASHRIQAKWIQEANWLQGLEGGIDASHASFLHRRFDPETVARQSVDQGAGGVRNDLMWQDKAPRLKMQLTNYGFRYAAIRDGTDESNIYVRLVPHIMPCSSYPPGIVGQDRIWNCWVPRDDETCWAWDVCFNETRPLGTGGFGLGVEEIKKNRGYYAYDPKTFHKYGNRENLWLQDREAMKTWSWTGIEGIFPQDNATQESMGAIVDRTKEHLGTVDLAIIAARRLYLKAARELAEKGIDPPGVWEQEHYHELISEAYIQPKDVPWQEARPLDSKFAPREAAGTAR